MNNGITSKPTKPYAGVVQYKYMTDVGYGNQAFTTATLTDISGMSISITPKYRNSKIMIDVNFGFVIGSLATGLEYRIYRSDGTVIQHRDYPNQTSGGSTKYIPVTFSAIDDDHGGLSRTYSLQAANAPALDTVTITGKGSSYLGRHMVVKEINDEGVCVYKQTVYELNPNVGKQINSTATYIPVLGLKKNINIYNKKHKIEVRCVLTVDTPSTAYVHLRLLRDGVPVWYWYRASGEAANTTHTVDVRYVDTPNIMGDVEYEIEFAAGVGTVTLESTELRKARILMLTEIDDS